MISRLVFANAIAGPGFRLSSSCSPVRFGLVVPRDCLFIRIEEYREIVIINPGCIELMAMGSRKEGLNGFLQVASAELPILDRAYEPLRIRFRMGR
jgi:hypothetical protein